MFRIGATDNDNFPFITQNAVLSHFWLFRHLRYQTLYHYHSACVTVKALRTETETFNVFTFLLTLLTSQKQSTQNAGELTCPILLQRIPHITVEVIISTHH